MAKHAGQRRPAAMRVKVGVAAVVAAVGGAYFLGSAVPAHASARPASAEQVAARDFATWQAHESKANLRRLVVDAYRLPGYGKAGTASDILQLAADVAGGAKAKYVATDVYYLREDFGGAN
jgi:hypothetical protein